METKQHGVAAQKLATPSHSQWVQHNKKTGREGGNASNIIDVEELNYTYTQAVQPDMNAVSRARHIVKKIIFRIRKMPRRKAVPSGGLSPLNFSKVQ